MHITIPSENDPLLRDVLEANAAADEIWERIKHMSNPAYAAGLAKPVASVRSHTTKPPSLGGISDG